MTKLFSVRFLEFRTGHVAFFGSLTPRYLERPYISRRTALLLVSSPFPIDSQRQWLSKTEIISRFRNAGAKISKPWNAFSDDSGRSRLSSLSRISSFSYLYDCLIRDTSGSARAAIVCAYRPFRIRRPRAAGSKTVLIRTVCLYALLIMRTTLGTAPYPWIYI